MYANREQWTEIRRQVLVEGMSKRQACQHYQINWKTLQKVLRHGEPPGYRRRKPVRRPIIDPVLPFIEQILRSGNRSPSPCWHR